MNCLVSSSTYLDLGKYVYLFNKGTFIIPIIIINCIFIIIIRLRIYWWKFFQTALFFVVVVVVVFTSSMFLTRHYWWACHFLKFYPLNVWCQTAAILSTDVLRRHTLLDLTYFKLNKLPHTIYWKSLITISGMSVWDVRLCDFNRFSWRKKMIQLFANSEYMYLEQTPLGLNCLLNTLFGDSRLKWVEHHKMPVKPHHMFTFFLSVNRCVKLFTSVLTLKAPSKICSRRHLFLVFFLIFQRKQVLVFHVNHLADDSHEISRLVFFEKI